MGNAAVSCAPLTICSSSPGGATKVLCLDGRLEVFGRQVKASELMVEHPGQFLCDSTILKVGNRIHGLTADEPLERRRFYFLLPMDLLYSVLTHEELSSLTYRASKALKNSRGFNNFSRIFPVFGDFRMFNPSESKRLDCDEDHAIINVNSSHNSEPVVLLERYSKQRSWKPALETIDETPCTL